MLIVAYMFIYMFTCFLSASINQSNNLPLLRIFSMERWLASHKTPNQEDQGLYQVCSPRQVAFTMALDRICNTHCCYPATMVTQTRLNSTLYVQSLSYLTFFCCLEYSHTLF